MNILSLNEKSLKVEFAWNSSNLAHDANIFVVYAVVIEKVKCYLYLVTRKWTKREISSLAKFMPKHNWGPTRNATKENTL
jgi:hypothetical protein